MKRFLLLVLCTLCVHISFSQTYAYRLTKVVDSDTGEVLANRGEKDLIYITFTSDRQTCYETDAYGNRINEDNKQPNPASITNISTEGSNYYRKISSNNGIITFKCTYKVYSYKRSNPVVLTYTKELSGESDDFLYFSTDYKKLNTINKISSRTYNPQTKTYSVSPLNGAYVGGKRTCVYERVDNPTQTNSDTPQKLW